jgi:thioredoxin reductase (NADPH)
LGARLANTASLAPASPRNASSERLTGAGRSTWRTTPPIEYNGQQISLRNDAVIVCAGGILPTAFLKSVGIDVETKYGTP